MGTNNITVSPYRHSPTSKYVVKGLSANGKRVRRFARTKAKANAIAKQLREETKRLGNNALQISDDLRFMAVACDERLKVFGKTLLARFKGIGRQAPINTSAT